MQKEIEKKYQITQFGFLPEQNAYELPAQWEPYLPLVQSLDHDNGYEFRRIVKELPEYDEEKFPISGVLNSQEKRFLYSLFSISQARYVWCCGEDVAQVVPKQIAVPLVKLAKEQEMPPHFSYYPSVAWNWIRLDEEKPISLDNTKIIFNFEQKNYKSISTFNLLHAEIEQAGGKSLIGMMEAKEYMKKNDKKSLLKIMKKVNQSLYEMSCSMEQFHSKLQVEGFYAFRHIFNGTMDRVRFPNGLKYEGFEGQDFSYPSVNAGQSPIMNVFDRFFNVQHIEDNQEFFKKSRTCILPVHQQFLDDVAQNPNVKTFIESSGDEELASMYKEGIRRFGILRKIHFYIVKKYIFDVMENKKIERKTLARGERDPELLLKTICDSVESTELKIAKKIRENQFGILVTIGIGLILASLPFLLQ